MKPDTAVLCLRNPLFSKMETGLIAVSSRFPPISGRIPRLRIFLSLLPTGIKSIAQQHKPLCQQNSLAHGKHPSIQIPKMSARHHSHPRKETVFPLPGQSHTAVAPAIHTLTEIFAVYTHRIMSGRLLQTLADIIIHISIPPGIHKNILSMRKIIHMKLIAVPMPAPHTSAVKPQIIRIRSQTIPQEIISAVRQRP